MASSVDTESGPMAGRREWAGLAVLALPTLLLSFDLSVLYLALPHLSADLGAGSTQQLWIMDIYGFMIAGFLVTMGTLGDRIGRRRLLLIGAAAFGVASVLAAMSTSALMLIITRAVLGIAGATLMPSTLALITNMFRNPKQRAAAIGVWMSCFMGGMAFGPVIGGVMLEWFWWGSVFLLGVPIMLLLLVVGPVLLPEYRDPSAGRLDPTSVALSLATILPVIYGLKEIAKQGWEPLPIAAILVGLGFGVAFVVRQHTLTHPLLDLRLFGSRTFSGALTLHLLVGAIQGGSLLLVNMYLQMVVGLSPLQAGLWLVPTALATMVGAMSAPAIAQRVRPAFVMAAGLVISAAGYMMLTFLTSTGSLPLLIVGFCVVMLGVGPTGALATDMIIGTAPAEKAGSASSLSETGGEFGIAFGIAALGSIGVAVYRNEMVGPVPPGVPADTARESLAGAVAEARDLPPALADQLLQSAREAFTSGLTLVAVLGAVLFVALATVAVATLRQMPPIGEVSSADGAPQQQNAEVAGTAVPVAEGRDVDDLGTPGEVTYGDVRVPDRHDRP